MQSEALQNLLNERYLRRAQRAQALRTLRILEDESEDRMGGLGGEPTSPENEVSTVLALPSPKGEIYLFTADAGVEALTDVASRCTLQRLHWMQIPHHGSRRNLNENLISHFQPKTCVVSAKGSIKHPSKKLVNALKTNGAKVWGTYYPDRAPNEGHWTRWRNGEVPHMDLVSVKELWD
jgi:hypothetical protein